MTGSGMLSAMFGLPGMVAMLAVLAM